MLCGDAGDSGITEKLLCIGKALLQIGAAAGFQIVDGGQNSIITRVGGNVLPARACYCCVCIEIDQRNIAAGSGIQTVVIKEVLCRSLGSIYAAVTRRRVGVCFLATNQYFGVILNVVLPFRDKKVSIVFATDILLVRPVFNAKDRVVFPVVGMVFPSAVFPSACITFVRMGVLFLLTGHRAGGIDDEHRCSLRGNVCGSLFQHNLQRDRIGVVFRVADGYSGLADGIDAVRQVLNRCAFSPATVFVIVTNLHVT